MGGLCSRSSNVNSAPGESFPSVNGHLNYGSALVYQSGELPAKINSNSAPSPAAENPANKPVGETFSFTGVNTVSYGTSLDDIPYDNYDGIPRLSRAQSHKSRSTKSKQVAVTKVSLDFCLIDALLLAVC